MLKWENNEEIRIFREYLQIESVQPNVNYEPCVAFLKKQAQSLELPVDVCYPAKKECPVVIITWKGLKPDLPSIFLNSHMDVVPVDASRWSHPPFAAKIDETGNIFARGAQDMKCAGMQYLAAIRAMKRDGAKLQRTIHVTFSPDEEIGSEFGMKAFVQSDAFEKLNVGFGLDESCAFPFGNSMFVFHAERTHCTMQLICEGQGGHGSMLIENSPGEKVHYMLDKMMQLRQREAQRLKDNPKLTPGDITTVNLTMLEGGLQSNVVPSEMRITFDLRLAIDVDHDAFEEQILKWCQEAGGGIKIVYELRDKKAPITVTDGSNPFWVAFESAIKELNLSITKWICPGGTDARFLREMNIPALGFMPLPNTPLRLHDNDEFIHADVYLNGISIYKKIVSNLGNAPSTDASSSFCNKL